MGFLIGFPLFILDLDQEQLPVAPLEISIPAPQEIMHRPRDDVPPVE